MQDGVRWKGLDQQVATGVERAGKEQEEGGMEAPPFIRRICTGSSYLAPPLCADVSNGRKCLHPSFPFLTPPLSTHVACMCVDMNCTECLVFVITTQVIVTQNVVQRRPSLGPRD